MTQVAAGLGLLEDCVIDQHFDQRNRYGRLLMIVSPVARSCSGIGVDEDTCATVTVEDGHEVLRVIGRGAVTILDRSRHGHERLRGQAVLAAAGSAASCSTCCRPARRST